jgi:hypothetical protein
MNWWPNFREQGYPGYLTPLPAFAAIAVPILALVDWLVMFTFSTREYFLRIKIYSQGEPSLL